MAIINELYFYPIKGFRGLRVPELRLDPKGPRWDRQWMLVDEKNHFLSQRQIPELARIGVSFEDDAAMELSVGEYGSADFGLEEREGDAFDVTVWKSVVPAFEVSSEVSGWLSDVLHRKVKLVRMSDAAKRGFNENYPERDVRFVDRHPLLVLSVASLKELELRAGVTLSVSRFRPNVVVDGVEAHAEDSWSGGFSVGALRFEAMHPCRRCKVTTVHPLTGQVGEEPLKTLETYRRDEKGLAFGYYFAHMNEGLLKAGSSLSF